MNVFRKNQQDTLSSVHWKIDLNFDSVSIVNVRIWLSSDRYVYPQNQTPGRMTTQLSAIYR
jgi:hypothetical protein